VGSYSGPDVSESGLVLALDGGSLKSFRGVNATNVLTTISYNQSNQNTTLFKVTNGSETVYIPSLGYVNSLYVDFYNDYNGGSGVCCPTLFSYGAGLAVSSSTTYTYSIIYKTTTGYSNANYMYRYERNSAGTIIGEAGVHSTNNRTSLGDGWWFAWGQFTTLSTAATLDSYLFHYEYATQNRVYVYRASLSLGTYVIPPEHMLTSGQVRGTTVATGGGWADLTGIGANGQLFNDPTYSSSNGGSIVFDGSNDYISCGALSGSFTSFTIITWFYPTVVVNYNNVLDGNSGYYTSGNVGPRLEMNSSGALGWGYSNDTTNNSNFYSHLILSSGLAANTWHYAAITYNGGSNTSITYYNGNATVISRTVVGTPTGFVGSMNSLNIGRGFGSSRYFQGRISQTQIYNRALTASEIQQNYNATKSRYGL
jgi:hypothetical protein